ncbi:MAG: hypothetical protein WCG99_03995 [Candidatus Berkelbacteria bacterium]
MQDTKYWPLFLLCWFIFLWAGIAAGRKQHHGPVTYLAHMLSLVCLMAWPLMLGATLGIKSSKPANPAVIVPLYVVVAGLVQAIAVAAAGKLWPGCIQCGCRLPSDRRKRYICRSCAQNYVSKRKK